MTTTELECVLCSSIMDAPTERLGPNTSTALAHSEYWESPEAIKVAEGIRRAITKGRPTHRVVVGLLMDPEYREWLRHPMFNNGLPLSCVEEAVQPLLRHYHNKYVVSYVGRTYELLTRNPDEAQKIAANLKAQLEAMV